MKVKTLSAIIWITLLFAISTTAFAEAKMETTNETGDPCAVDTKGMSKNQKQSIDRKCKLALAEIDHKIAEKEVKPTPPLVYSDDEPGRVVKKNNADLTVTERSEETYPDGSKHKKGREMSKEAAKHEKDMANIDRKKAVGIAKAEHPRTCCYGGGYYGNTYPGGYYSSTTYSGSVSAGVSYGYGGGAVAGTLAGPGGYVNQAVPVCQPGQMQFGPPDQFDRRTAIYPGQPGYIDCR